MRYLLILIFVCTLLTGCRVNPRAEREIALLRAEILDLEDQYYALKDRCEEKGVSTDSQYYDSEFVDGECIDCEPGTIIYENPADATYDRAPTEVNPSEELESIEPTIDDGTSSRLEILPHTGDVLPEKVSYSGGNRSGNRQDIISSIAIDRNSSRGEDIDGIPGHEGLSLLIQPLDDYGNIHKIAGKLMVRISESKSENVERQIGLWQFTPRETESFFVRDEVPEQGILLHLPWDGLIPTERVLRVFVRYTTRDNRKLDTQFRIQVDPPGSAYSIEDPLVAGWVEKDDRWKDIEFEPASPSSVARENDPRAVGREPAFRAKTPNTEQRISAPGWRPVR